MTFGAPAWLLGMLVIPILALLFWRAERRSALRLREFASLRLLPQLAGTVNRARRALRFGLLLLAVIMALFSLAQPRLGYTYEDVKRQGLDVILAVDTSRSMLANDTPPSRLQRVKLAAHDLINELQGDRIGLIAFAGRAFLQAPLTIDYSAAAEAVDDLDTNTIPEGGSNISQAISLAASTYGKSAVGNRALIIFTDGEELDGDAIKSAKAAADAGVRIFTVGVGTPEGSLIPITGEGGGTAFVKDSKGQVVKSKLDEKRLREIAEATGGVFLRLENEQRTMRGLLSQGLGKMESGEIDARTSRRPIERYQWPLAAALLALALSILINERKRERLRRVRKQAAALAALAFALSYAQSVFAAAPGLEAYRDQKFPEAYEQFQQTLKEHPQTRATDKIQFDSGAAAYKMQDYGKALQSFSQALLSPDAGLQSKSHYNLGNTLYQRGESQKADQPKLTDWTNALQHYEQALKLEPESKEAKDNYEFVKKKIEELKNKPPPEPTPTPSPKPQDKQKKPDQSQKDQEQQQKDQSGQSEDQKSQDEQKEENKSGQNKEEASKPGESPSPSPGEIPNSGASPSPSPGGRPSASPSASSEGDAPSPSPGEEDGSESGEDAAPSPTPAASPEKKLAGEVKGAAEEKSGQEAPEAQAAAEREANEEGQMSEEQAERLLRSMKDEEERVQLDERKASRRVYNDW